MKIRLALMINSLNAYSGYFHSQVDGDVGFDTRAQRVTSDHVHFRRRQEPEKTLHVVGNLPDRHLYIRTLNPILVRQLQKKATFRTTIDANQWFSIGYVYHEACLYYRPPTKCWK